MKDLDTLRISLGRVDPVGESSVPLSSLFSAFPPRLLYVNARQFSFPDFDPLLFHESPTLPPLGVPRLECLVPIREDHTPVTVWKDSIGGKKRWCYHVEDEDLAET
jgi:hypothetical protein